MKSRIETVIRDLKDMYDFYVKIKSEKIKNKKPQHVKKILTIDKHTVSRGKLLQ